MDYSVKLSDEHRLLEKSVKNFCETEIRPGYASFVENKRFPREIFLKLGEQGYLGAMIPQEYGGAGMSMADFVVLTENLARYGGGSLALTVAAQHSLAAAHILYAGSEEQKRQYLPKLASGEAIGAWCLTEQGSGSDAFGSMLTTAYPLPCGSWQIDGIKQFITNGSIADIYVVVASIVATKNYRGGFGAFIIGAKSVSTQGALIKFSPEKHKIGMHASDTATVSFDGIVVPQSAKILVDNFDGLDTKKSVHRVLNNGRLGVAAMACGLARSALSEAVSYASQRKTFGQLLKEYQGATFPLADAASELESAWALVRTTAQAADAGTPSHPTDRSEGKLSPELASKTKLKATVSAYNACLAALLTWGGSGYMLENRVAQDFCDSILLRIGEGTYNMQRITIAKAIFER